MKTILIVFIIAVMAGGLSAKTSKPGSIYPSVGNGYITIDRNIVVLPQRLQWGDKIALFNIQGSKVLEAYVGGGYLETDVSNLPRGLYTMLVLRKNTTIAAKIIPIFGSEKS